MINKITTLVRAATEQKYFQTHKREGVLLDKHPPSLWARTKEIILKPSLKPFLLLSYPYSAP